MPNVTANYGRLWMINTCLKRYVTHWAESFCPLKGVDFLYKFFWIKKKLKM